MKKVLMYLWMLPQNLLGLLLLNYYKPTRLHELEDGTKIMYSSRINGGLSMGKYVYVAATHYRNDLETSLHRDTVRHNAVGHSKQSKILGWLYLPALLLSMIVGAMLWCDKYRFGMERWADKIANVTRKR